MRKYQLGCPAHSTSISSVSWNGIFRSLADHFVHDGAVVNPHDRCPLALHFHKTGTCRLCLTSVIDTVFMPSNFSVSKKVRQGFLMQRIDLHQDHVLGIMFADNGPPQQFLVALPIQSAQQIFQVRIQTENFSVRLRQHRLICVERREALQFNQFGLQLAGLVAHQSEIHLNKKRIRGFPRNFELIRNRGRRGLAVLDAVELLNQFLAVLRHLVDQRLWAESTASRRRET